MNELGEISSSIKKTVTNKPDNEGRRIFLKGASVVAIALGLFGPERALQALAEGNKNKPWNQNFSEELIPGWSPNTEGFVDNGSLAIKSGESVTAPSIPPQETEINIVFDTAIHSGQAIDVIFGGVKNYKGVNDSTTQITGENPLTITITADSLQIWKQVGKDLQFGTKIDLETPLSQLTTKLIPNDKGYAVELFNGTTKLGTHLLRGKHETTLTLGTPTEMKEVPIGSIFVA